MTLYISVKRAVIEANKKNGTNHPPFEIRKSKDDRNPIMSPGGEFTGKIRMVYNKTDPLVSQAYCWIEVEETDIRSSAPHPPRPEARVIHVGIAEAAEAKDGM